MALCFIINCNSIYYQWMPLGYFWIFTIIILLLLIYFERKDNMFSIFLGIIIIISFWVFPLIIDIINGPISTFVSTFLGFVPLLLLYYKIVDDKTSLLLKSSTLISILSFYSIHKYFFSLLVSILIVLSIPLLIVVSLLHSISHSIPISITSSCLPSILFISSCNCSYFLFSSSCFAFSSSIASFSWSIFASRSETISAHARRSRLIYSGACPSNL